MQEPTEPDRSNRVPTGGADTDLRENRRREVILQVWFGPDSGIASEPSSMPDGEHELLAGSPAHSGDNFWKAFQSAPAKGGVTEATPFADEDVARLAKRARAEIDRQIEGLGNRTLIVRRSYSDWCSPGFLARLQRFLGKRFRKIRVQIRISNPERHMVSRFIQQLEQPSGNWRIASALPAYRKLLERFETVFGRDSVIYQIDGGTLPVQQEAVGSLDGVALLFAYRTYCWHHRENQLSPENAALVLEALKKAGTTHFGFSKTAVQMALQFRAKDVKWLKRRLGHPVSAEGVEGGIGCGEELLKRSVTASRFLSEPGDPAATPARSAREAVERLVDFANRMRIGNQAFQGPFATDLIDAEKDRLTAADPLSMESPPTCYIHVGMPKTGTTSIQDALSENRPATDFAYLKIRPANHSRLIFTVFSKNPEKLPYYRKLGLGRPEIDAIRADYTRKLERQVRQNRSRKLLISGETIFQLQEEDLHEMAAFFQRLSVQVRIVAYLRPIKSFMESVFQQRLKRGVAVGRFEAVYPDYAARIRAFDQVFGEANVILRKFDRSLFPDGDVVVDFCQLTGTAMDGYEPSRLNETMCTEAIALLYAFHHFGGSTGVGKDSMRLSGEWIKRMQSLKGSRFSLARSVVRRVVRSHQEDLQWMEQRCGFPLDSASDAKHPDAIRSFDGLLSKSMEGARLLIESTAGDFPHEGPLPGTPWEAAAVVRDYLRWKRPDLPIALNAPEP